MHSQWTVSLVTLFILQGFHSQAETPVERSGLARWTAAQKALVADASVVAYYDFQDGKGTTLKNKSGAGASLDGTIRDAQWVDGRWSGKKALSFDGRKSAVEIPSIDALCPLDKEKGGTGEMTVEVWLKAETPGEAGIVDKSSAGMADQAPYMIWVSPRKLVAYVGKQSDKRNTSAGDPEALFTGEWIHVAMVIGTDSISLYRDGLLVGRSSRGAKVSDNGKPLLLGSMGFAGRFHFKGLIDEVVIYKRALPVSAVKARAALFPESTGHQSLTLISPNAGDRWNAGAQHNVKWEARNIRKARTLAIEYSADGGKTWKTISKAAANTGEFLWRVPDEISDDYKVRIKASGHDIHSQSEARFSIVRSPTIPEYQWIKVAFPAAFAPRDGAGALVYQDRMWLLGGWNPRSKKFFPRICNNEVWRSQDGADWSLVKPNTFKDRTFNMELDWEGRHTAGYVVHDDKMWIVGGDANQGHYQFDVWNSSDGKSWSFVNKGKPVPWGPRVLHYTLAFDDRIWVMGGQTIPQFGSGKEAFYRDIWNTTDGVTWKRVTPKEPFWPQRGMIGGNVVFKDRMWILGGGTYDTPQTPKRKYFNDVWSSADGVNWQCHTESAPWAPRQYHEVAVFDDRLWVLEGYSGRNRNDVWHSDDGVNWYELKGTPWSSRHAASVFVHDNALWMVAGNNMQSDVWKLVRTRRHRG